MTHHDETPNLQECPSQDEYKADYDTDIHSNPDAVAWAKFFVETCRKSQFHVGTAQGVMQDGEVESWMTTWFANAMMAQHDHLQRKIDAKGITELCVDHPNLMEYISDLERQILNAKCDLVDAKSDAKANFDSWMDAIADCFPEDHPCHHCEVTGETVIDAIKDLQKQLVKSCQDRIEDVQERKKMYLDVADAALRSSSSHEEVVAEIRRLRQAEKDGAKMLGMATDLNLDLQNKADMWRDEFQRIKAICHGKSLDFLEIAGICDRAAQNIRSNISLIDQREKVAEENAELRRKLVYYDALRQYAVGMEAKKLHGLFQAAANGKDMAYCKAIAEARLNYPCPTCDGRGCVGGPIQGGDGSSDTFQCGECDGEGYIKIPA